MRKKILALLFILIPGQLLAAKGPTCKLVTIDGQRVYAKKTASGLSTLACEMVITVRITDRLKAGFKVQPKVTPQRCTVWVSAAEDEQHGIVPRAWDACIDSMHHAAEAE